LIKGVGTDIIEVKRIRKLMEDYGERFFTRILTENEINYCKKFSKTQVTNNSSANFAPYFFS